MKVMGLNGMRTASKTLTLIIALMLCLANSLLLTGIAKAEGEGTISGTVTEAVTTQAIEGVSVGLYDSNGNSLGGTSTDVNGHYEFLDLAPGNHRIKYEHSNYWEEIKHSSEWYHGASTYGTATWVTVNPGVTATADEELVRLSGTISGTVTDAVTGAPIPGVEVSAYDSYEENVWLDLTDENGHYETAELPTGTYLVCFRNDEDHVAEWYHNAYTFGTATEVNVTSAATTIVDEELTPYGAISVMIYDAATMLAIEGANITLYDAGSNAVGVGSTEANGHYEFVGLAPGAYRMSISGYTYKAECYENRTSLKSADEVNVLPGATATVNGYLEHGDWSEGLIGYISGTVTDAVTGAPIPDVSITLYDPTLEYWTFTSNSHTIWDGTYSEYFPAGTYLVRFFAPDDNHKDEWYHDNWANTHGATEITIAEGGNTIVNESLTPTGVRSLSGTVTDAVTTQAIEGVSVGLYDSKGNSLGGTGTDVNGHYEFLDLVPGNYRIKYERQYYSSEWYHGASTYGTATWVTVNPGGTATADEELVRLTGTISGTVTDAVTDAPISGALVSLFNAYEGNLWNGGVDENGYYEIAELPTGTYLLYFNADDVNYLDEWFHNAYTFGTATEVIVTSAATTIVDEDMAYPTITATAGPGGSITPSGGVSVVYGSDQAFTIMPTANYQVADVLVDGVSVGAVPNYTFYNVIANHTITAAIPPPVIASISPTSGVVGTVVTIKGSGFGATRGTSYVKFGGLKATSYPSWSDTQVTCKVPAAAAGKVNLTLTTAGGVSNALVFKVKPKITGVTPTTGASGTVVTIKGSGFGSSRGTSFVKFGGTKATSYVSWSNTQVKCKVPAGASGVVGIAVTTAGGKSNPVTFKVKPKIVKITPVSGTPGTVVTVTGTGFGARRGTSYVTFGTTKVTSYVSWSNTQVKVKVPATGVGTKLVKVTTSGGTSAGVSFTVR
jgi:5-hydroxyisourate hydrolase-like protein (transthyretin family)